MDTNNDSKFIGSFAASLRYWRTGLDPDPNGADRLHVSGCIPQLEIDAVTSFVNKGRTPVPDSLQAASGKRKFQPDNRHGYEKYNDSNGDESFLGFDEKGSNVYMKHCNVLIEPTAKSRDKKKGTKTDKKEVHEEREEERDSEVEMIVRRKWTKKVNKLVMNCSY